MSDMNDLPGGTGGIGGTGETRNGSDAGGHDEARQTGKSQAQSPSQSPPPSPPSPSPPQPKARYTTGDDASKLPKSTRLREAWAWTCDECCRDNYCESPTATVAELRSRQYPVDDELADDISAKLLPDVVRCSHCNEEFAAVAPYGSQSAFSDEEMSDTDEDWDDDDEDDDWDDDDDDDWDDEDDDDWDEDDEDDEDEDDDDTDLWGDVDDDEDDEDGEGEGEDGLTDEPDH